MGRRGWGFPLRHKAGSIPTMKNARSSADFPPISSPPASSSAADAPSSRRSTASSLTTKPKTPTPKPAPRSKVSSSAAKPRPPHAPATPSSTTARGKLPQHPRRRARHPIAVNTTQRAGTARSTLCSGAACHTAVMVPGACRFTDPSAGKPTLHPQAAKTATPPASAWPTPSRCARRPPPDPTGTLRPPSSLVHLLSEIGIITTTIPLCVFSLWAHLRHPQRTSVASSAVNFPQTSTRSLRDG